MRILTYNANIVPFYKWFGSNNLRHIKNRKHQIRERLRSNNYDVALIQEDFTRDLEGIHAGKFPPTGLTLQLPTVSKRERKLLLKGNWDWEQYKDFGWESGDWLTRKGFMWADLHGLRFYNTHLDAGDGDGNIRRKQLSKLLNKIIQKQAKDPRPTIVAGDFNPESPDELDFLFDSFFNLGFKVNYAPNKKMKDFIFTKSVPVLGVYEDKSLSVLSDHPAMYIDII